MEQQLSTQAETGVEGLDDVLDGGFDRGRVYLLEGNPGTGKTTIALKFLLSGVAAGERYLYITLSETTDELHATACSHGWSLDDMDIFELLPSENLLDAQQQQSLLYSSDLELGETTSRIFEKIEEFQPSRVVLDSLSEIRLLAQSSLRYRRQILALKHYFARSSATVLMLDDLTTDINDKTVHSVAHGVVQLEELPREYGGERRRLKIKKYRARKYRGGYHDMAIRTGGVQVYPRLISAEHHKAFVRTTMETGSTELNALLGGGIERGSSVLMLGPAGTGKSLIALTIIKAAIARGECAAMFVFDEELGLLRHRALGLKIDLAAMEASGHLVLEQVDAAELTPGEFSARVRDCVEKYRAQTIVVDSLNGYQASMPGEHALILHIHELLQYLNRQGATTYLTVAQHGMVGGIDAPVDVTYLADTVIVLRYFEVRGRVRRAISVVKKRMSAHEDSIREYQINSRGITLGAPLTGFQGILRGVPSVLGGEGFLEEEAL